MRRISWLIGTLILVTVAVWGTGQGQRSAAGAWGPHEDTPGGLLIVAGQTSGYYNYAELDDIVQYSHANSESAYPDTFAIFQNHDPWGHTYLKDRITAHGWTYNVLPFSALPTTNFTNYRVVVLNFDDTSINTFLSAYEAARPALESYARAGGVVWLQSAVQGFDGTTYSLPFGGSATYAAANTNYIVDPASPMITGMPNPFTGNYASMAHFSGIPAHAHAVVRETNASGPITLYEYQPALDFTPTPTATPPASPCGTRGLLIAAGQTNGYSNYAELDDIVQYSHTNGNAAAPDIFAVFQNHDPWGHTYLKDRITAHGWIYSVLPFSALSTTNLANYRVVVLNFDDTNISTFLPAYQTALPALQSYVSGGGVLWLQSAVLGFDGATYPLPFSGTAVYHTANTNYIVDPGSPMIAGMANPFTGNAASHAYFTEMPGRSHSVVRESDANGPVTLFEYRPSVACTPTPTPTTGPPPCGALFPGTWTAIAPLNTGRSRPGAAYSTVTNKFYVLGGEAGAGRNIPIEEYDLAANTWTNRAQLLIGVSNTSAAAAGAYIYVPGGYDGTNAHSEMQRFDPVANVVTTVSPMPAANMAHAVAVQGSKIYVLGGAANSVEGTTNFIYDTVAGTWSTGAVVPTPVEYAAAASDGTYIYLIGGRTQAQSDLNIVQRYNPATNSWAPASSLLTPRGGPGAFFDGLRIWAVNGGWGSYLDSTESYRPGSPGWEAGPHTVSGARTIGAAFSANRMLAIKAGGYGTGSYLTATEKLVFGTIPCPSPSATPTRTTLPSPTRTATPRPTVTPIACTVQFTDVPAGSTFYPYIHCLACKSIVGGYADNTFRPGNPVTRGQLAKFVANAAGYTDDVTGRQTFRDVPPTDPFWLFIERAYAHGVISGYSCGTGCLEFRPGNNVTRGQVAKFVANAALYNDAIPPAQQTFRDVPPTDPFWLFIERAYAHGVISGYTCGGTGEPCPGLYFRPTNSVTRGQTAKFIANAFFPGCEGVLRR